MPQPCKICNHAQRWTIEGMLVEGSLSLREIGARFNVTKDSLSRHARAHLAELTKPKEGSPENEPRQDGENSPPIKKADLSLSIPASMFGTDDRINWEDLLSQDRPKVQAHHPQQSREVWALLDEAAARLDEPRQTPRE